MAAHRAIWKADARTCAAKAQDSLARNSGRPATPERKSFISELRGQVLARGAKKRVWSRPGVPAKRRNAMRAGAAGRALAIAYGLQLPQGS